MTSTALTNWNTTGQGRLNELVAVHKSSAGGSPGRKWGTQQLNRSLFVALVAQFQVYCIELHDLGVDLHVVIAFPNQANLLRTLLTVGRKLESQNPRKSSLGADFGRLGFKFVPEVEKSSLSAPQWLNDLDDLVDFRNAIAHGNETEVSAISNRTRLRSTKTSFEDYRKILQRLAPIIDETVAIQMSTLLGITRPW
jgi:hypothetical protein